MNKKSNQELASLIIIFVFGYSVMVFLLNHFLKPMMARRVEGFIKKDRNNNLQVYWEPHDNPPVWSSMDGDYGYGTCSMTNERGRPIPNALYEIEHYVVYENGKYKDCCKNLTLDQFACKLKGEPIDPNHGDVIQI